MCVIIQALQIPTVLSSAKMFALSVHILQTDNFCKMLWFEFYLNPILFVEQAF